MPAAHAEAGGRYVVGPWARLLAPRAKVPCIALAHGLERRDAVLYHAFLLAFPASAALVLRAVRALVLALVSNKQWTVLTILILLAALFALVESERECGERAR